MKKCRTCRFWDTSTFDGDDSDTTGCCRINPPTVHIITGRGVWPITSDEDGCHAHKPVQRSRKAR